MVPAVDEAFEVVEGREEGARFGVGGAEVRIGRDPAADVVLTDPRVSRRHARVWIDGGALLVEDLDSTGGTVVNGNAISRPTALARGDVLTLGATRLRVLWTPAPAATMLGPVVADPPPEAPATVVGDAPPPAREGPDGGAADGAASRRRWFRRG